MKRKILFILMATLVSSQLLLSGCGKKETVVEEPVIETAEPEQIVEPEVSEPEAEPEVKEEAPMLPTIKGTLHIEIKEDASGENIVDFDGNTIKGIKNREIILEDEAKTVLSDMGADVLGWRWEDASGNGYYVWACSYETADKANFSVDVLAEEDYAAEIAARSAD